jgi:hypothetical protein
MTLREATYTVVISLSIFFFGWIITPALDRVRDKWRARAAAPALTPANEAAMFKQLRMQQAMLKRLEQFRESPNDTILYLLGLLGAGLLFFVATVYLYSLRFELVGLYLIPAAMSLFLLAGAVLESRNMTGKKMDKTLAELRTKTEELKIRLKVLE